MLIPAILSRRSVRMYKTDPITDAVIREIIFAGQCAPTAHGTSAIEFVIITDPDMKQKIFEIIGQDFVKEAPVLIMPVATDASVLPVQDLSVASQNILLQATELGLGSVWKNLTSEWEGPVKALCGVPSTYRAINIIPIGISAEDVISRNIDDGDLSKIHQERW